MSLLPTKKQFSTWSLPSRYSYFGMVVSVFSLVLSISSYVYQQNKSTDIQTKINELDNIQTALATLNTYVSNQQNVLARISEEKSNIENESARVKSALEIDKEKLDSLLEYQVSQQKSGMLLEIIISFFVGVFSSSLVTYIASRIKKPKEAAVEQ